MKRLLFSALAFFALFAAASALRGQTALDRNEGTRLTTQNGQGSFSYSWWGRAGRTYFIQQSEDLATWTYVPIIEKGANLPIEWGFTSTGERFFLRLKASDLPAADPYTADFDGDGVSNWDELNNGTDVFVPQAPFAPANLRAVPGDGAVTLTWNPTPGAAIYTVRGSTTSGDKYIELTTVGKPTVTVTETDLANGQTYYFVVVASNAGGSSPYSAEVSATPSSVGNPGVAPSAPKNFRATRISDTKVRYEWDDTSNNEEGFILMGKGSNGEWTEISRVGPDVKMIEVNE